MGKHGTIFENDDFLDGAGFKDGAVFEQGEVRGAGVGEGHCDLSIAGLGKRDLEWGGGSAFLVVNGGGGDKRGEGSCRQSKDGGEVHGGGRQASSVGLISGSRKSSLKGDSWA